MSEDIGSRYWESRWVRTFSCRRNKVNGQELCK